jgi:hypothetical protein
MNNKINNSIIKQQSNEKISRLIALPLLKKEYPKGGVALPDLNLDSIINIQKMINTRAEKNLARFQKGKDYFLEYSNNLSDYFNNTNIKNTNISKEVKILDLKNLSDNNKNIKIPVLRKLSDTIENIIYEDAPRNIDRITNKQRFNYSIPKGAKPQTTNLNLKRGASSQPRELIFRKETLIKTISTYN